MKTKNSFVVSYQFLNMSLLFKWFSWPMLDLQRRTSSTSGVFPSAEPLLCDVYPISRVSLTDPLCVCLQQSISSKKNEQLRFGLRPWHSTRLGLSLFAYPWFIWQAAYRWYSFKEARVPLRHRATLLLQGSLLSNGINHCCLFSWPSGRSGICFPLFHQYMMCIQVCEH